MRSCAGGVRRSNRSAEFDPRGAARDREQLRRAGRERGRERALEAGRAARDAELLAGGRDRPARRRPRPALARGVRRGGGREQDREREGEEGERTAARHRTGETRAEGDRRGALKGSVGSGTAGERPRRAIVTRPMATASAPAAAPSATSRRPRRAALRLLPAAATVVGVAALLDLVYDRFLNYDARYALVWARDLARGLKPDYRPTSRPPRIRWRPRSRCSRRRSRPERTRCWYG